MSNGSIELALPKPFQEISGLGIDSEVRGWSAKGPARIEYDYGIFSTAYSGGAGDSSVKQCLVNLDGWQVEVVRYPRADRGSGFHAYWLDPKAHVTRGKSSRPTLMMYGYAPDSAARETLLAVLPTVRRLR